MKWFSVHASGPDAQNGTEAGRPVRCLRKPFVVGRALPKASEQASRRGVLEIRLFGQAEVTVDGAPFALATPRKSLQVLAYLLLHRSAPVAREYLAFLLYPDDEEVSAKKKLRATLSELPKVLPAGAAACLSVETERIAWNPRVDLWLDVDAFVEASSDRDRLAEAIELYRGDLLPEIYDEWLDAIRERHRNTYLRCLSERVSEARLNAELGLAIETARKVLTVDPWREDMVRRIIAMRYESGDRAGALNEYAAFAKRLRAEMAAEPMVETAAVAERIALGQALQDEDSDLGRLAAIERPPILPFVGRRDKMESLLESWNRVSRGRGAAAFIAGESGIGKTRIARELAHAVEDRGGCALGGITSSPEAVPYESIVDALRSGLALLASLKPGIALASVAALVPEIRARVPLVSPPRLDAENERIRLFESLFRCFAELSARRPLLVVLEDLHWAQTATLDLLQFLLRRIVESRVMIVVTYRDEETPRMHPLRRLQNEMRASESAVSIRLGGLSVRDIEQLRAACPEISDRSTEALVATSQGNPLFLTQMVIDVREGERASAVPTLQAFVERRIERLSDQAMTAAEIAACMGDRFSGDAVREVSAWDDAALGDALDELLDRRIVREVAGRGIFEYAFTHRALLDAIAERIPPQRAVLRRRRLARVLEELYQDRAAELAASVARLYDLGGDNEAAARCYLAAARHSISVGALDEARSQCDRGLLLSIEPRVRVDIALEGVTIEARRGEREQWNAALLALESAEPALADPEIHRSAILRRIDFSANFGEHEMQADAVEKLRACTPDGDVQGNATLHLAASRLAFARDRLAEAFACAEKALECSRTIADDAGTARALCALAEVEALRGHLAAAGASFELAGEIATRANDPKLEQLSLRSGWAIAYQNRDVRRCVAIADRWLELAISLGDRPEEAEAHSRFGVSLAAADDSYASAREHFANAVATLLENGDVVSTAGPLLNQGVLECRLGFFDRALALTENATKLFQSAGNARGEATGLENLVLLRAYAGRVDDAREAARTALGLAHDLELGLVKASVTENLAFAEATAGNLAQAVGLAEKSFELRRLSESQAWSSKTLADVAIWHATLGNLDAAREAVRRLLADEDGIVPGTEWPQCCYWSAAQVLHLDGRQAESRAALEQAWRLVQKTADQLEPEDRRQFLGISWHADIVAAIERDVWPSPMRF